MKYNTIKCTFSHKGAYGNTFWDCLQRIYALLPYNLGKIWYLISQCNEDVYISKKISCNDSFKCGLCRQPKICERATDSSSHSLADTLIPLKHLFTYTFIQMFWEDIDEIP